MQFRPCRCGSDRREVAHALQPENEVHDVRHAASFGDDARVRRPLTRARSNLQLSPFCGISRVQRVGKFIPVLAMHATRGWRAIGRSARPVDISRSDNR